MKNNKLKIGLNGYGRIGRIFHRIALERDDLDVVVINSRGSSYSHAHLLKYDSVYGRLSEHIVDCKDDNCIEINGEKVVVLRNKEPGEINWRDYGVDIVVEATGKFKDRKSNEKHLKNGAKKVVIAAPGKKEDISIVLGVNEDQYDPKKHDIISNASCTTNALSLLIKILKENYEINSIVLTTIHSITNSQNILDSSHNKNLRIARAAYESFIPSTTGASKAIVKLFPDLKGKIIAKSVRVPVATVSLLDIFVQFKENVNEKKLKKDMIEYSNGPMAGLLAYSEEPLVSVDFVGEKNTTVVDGDLLKVTNGKTANVVAWYDNEWGYTERLADLTTMVGTKVDTN